MNATAVFELIEQGLTLLPLLIQAGVDITQKIEQLQTLAKAGKDGTITDEDLTKIRADFDNDINSFNQPM